MMSEPMGEVMAVDGGVDVRTQVQIDDGGDDVSVVDSGGAAPVQADQDIDDGGAVRVPVEEGDVAVPVPVDDEEGAVLDQVPDDEEGSMVL